MTAAAYIKLAVHPVAWDRIMRLLESQGLDPQPAARPGEYSVTPTADQLKAWRREAMLADIPAAELTVERIEHDGQQAHENSAGVRIRHLPTQITVESRNHRKLLRNQVDALHVLADRLADLKQEGVTPWWTQPSA